jgi:hypothetical protein
LNLFQVAFFLWIHFGLRHGFWFGSSEEFVDQKVTVNIGSVFGFFAFPRYQAIRIGRCQGPP